jgi:N-acetylglucosaminyldiphosphoundecaprenol N-acetyl-beta-D-mannosaminyltransferase
VVEISPGSMKGSAADTVTSVAVPQHPGNSPEILPSDGLARVELFDLAFVDAPSVEVIASHLLAAAGSASAGAAPLVVTPNVDFLVNLDRQGGDEVRNLLGRARWILPDGQPIVAASRLLGRPLSARLAGSTLFAVLWPQLVRDGASVLVVASTEEVARRLRVEHESATVVVAPRLAADDSDGVDAFAASCLSLVGPDAPRFVISCIGHPRDLRLLTAILDRWDERRGPLPIAFGCGAAAEMYVGLRRRAPRWMQAIGMEWFFRFCQEPRRLFRRYFVDGVRFLPMVLAEARRARTGRR